MGLHVLRLFWSYSLYDLSLNQSSAAISCILVSAHSQIVTYIFQSMFHNNIQENPSITFQCLGSK